MGKTNVQEVNGITLAGEELLQLRSSRSPPLILAYFKLQAYKMSFIYFEKTDGRQLDKMNQF